MRKKILVELICFCLLLSFYSAFSQTTIDAEFRPRTEFRQGFKQPLLDGTKPAVFTLQRTRLNFNYKNGVVSGRLVLQDSRIFGETNTKQPSTATTGSLGIYEAWAEMSIPSGISLKIGRQGIQFEDGRLFSLSPWSNTGNAHDLAQLKYIAPDFEAQLGYAYNNQKAYNADSSYYSVSKMYKELVFLHMVKTLVPGLKLSILGVDEGFMKGKTNLDLYHRYSTGGTLQMKDGKNPLGFLVTGYYQFGKSAPTVDLDAYLLAFKATYAFTQKVGGKLGVDYYSGTGSSVAATKTNTFNKLPYGVNHSFNGYMDYWATLPQGGLLNYYGGVSLKLNNRLSSDINYYRFQLAEGMRSGANEIQKNIGSELDLVLNYKFSPETAIQFAWCTYFETDGTKMLKYASPTVSTRFPQFAYVMFTIKPKLYKTPVATGS